MSVTSNPEQFQHVAEVVAKTGTYTGASVAFVGGLTVNEFAALAGVVIGLVGLGFQIYFGYRRDRRERHVAE